MVKKRFIFSVVSIIAVSVTTILMKYPPEIYFKLVSIISAIYIGGQSYTDIKGKNARV